MAIGPSGLRRAAGRVGATLVNGLEVARFGGLRTDAEPSPFVVEHRAGIGDLRHYFPETVPADAPTVLLVPPLMLTAEVWDVSPSTSAVAALHARGVDAWVVDFGSPEETEGGTQRTLAEHVESVSEAVDVLTERTGGDVHLAGYSQGGMFCYQVAAYRRSEGIASVVTFGSPVDVHSGIPFGLPVGEVLPLVSRVARGLFASSGAPGWMTSTVFKLFDPVKTVRARIDFVRQLHDRESLLDREPQRRFLDGEGFVAWPGPALADFAEQFLRHNRMLSGGFEVGGRMVTLADLRVPVLVVLGDRDELAPPAGVRGIGRAAPGAPVMELELPAGHFGLVVGSRASQDTWPAVADWLHHQAGDGPLPAGVVPLRDPTEPAEQTLPDARQLASLTGGLGVDLARGVVGAAGRALQQATELAGAAVDTLPQVLRLARVEATTRVSLGQLLAEQVDAHPEQTFFLFEGRGYTYAAAGRRIDAVVRGLLSLGVRQGEHVAVMMHTRPSGLALVAALNRLGAVAVLLRPDGDVAREVELGGADRVICDPEHIDVVRDAVDLPVAVLGGGGEERDLGRDVLDMERIDPDAVTVPDWYQPDAGRAADLAFVLFSGAGEDVRANHVTNRRWALSAFGTASTASLSASDTVYGITPLHHPSGILTAVGGAVAGGARLALTGAFDPATFWEEVRRYGVTVVAYTWTLCRDLVNAPPDPREAHHPIRLFLGSGMPVSVWRRVTDRFAPARVLEFYASTEGQAVLANVDGRRVGAKGRPLPGSVDVAVVRYDLDGKQLVLGPDGLAERTAPDEVGLLLAREPAGARASTVSPLRSVLAPGDAWRSTGDLFRVDGDGVHWLVGSVGSAVRTVAGRVPLAEVEDAAMHCPAVDLAVAYGVPGRGDRDVLVVAVTLVEGATLDVERCGRILANRLPPGHVPAVLRIVDDVETTTWYRPRRSSLRAEGLPLARAHRWEPGSRRYRELTAQDRERLLGGVS